MDKKLLYFVRSLFLNFYNSAEERSFTPGLRLLCLGMFFVISFSNAAIITSTASGGNWNVGSTWSGGNIPLATDIVVIANGANVLTNGNQTCAGITITGRLTMINNEILTVNGNVSGNGNWTTGGGTMTISLTGNWNFTGTSTGSGATAIFTGTNTQMLSGKITTTGGELKVNKTGGSVILASTIGIGAFTNTAGIFDAATYLLTATTNNLVAGTLRVGASTWSANYSFIPTSIPSGFTIEYDGGNQTVNSSIQYQNLLISGTNGSKTAAGNLTINNDFLLTGSTFVASDGGGTTTHSILGNYNQTGGIFEFNSGNNGTSIVNLAGNFSNTAGATSITTTGLTNNGILYFNGTGIQTLYIPTASATGYVDYNVKIGSTLKLASSFSARTSATDNYTGKLNVSGTIDFGIYTFTATLGTGGSAKFVLNSGATLITANSGGVDGSVPVSSEMVRNFNSGANYTFNGTGAQTTSTGMPPTVNNLTISNTHASGVTLSKATTVSKIFAVTAGSIANLSTFNHTTSTLTLGGAVMIPLSWGSTGSSAVNKNDTFFVASASGIINNNCTSPTVTTHPLPLTICEGTGGAFSVASSTPTVNYQWQYSSNSVTWFNIDAALGTIAAGYTTNMLTLNNTPAGWNGYRIRCVVRNNLCAANSNSALLTVNFLPTDKIIAVESATVCSGSATNVTVSASQTGVSYQLRNASNIAIGSAVAGNGGTINLATGNLSATTTFNVLATNSSSTTCFLQMSNPVTVTVNTNNLSTQVGGTSTFCTDNSTTYTTPVATPGQYALVDVIKGFKYDFSVGDAFSGASEVLTILDASSDANVSPATTNNGATGTTITDWVSSISGQIKVVLTTLNCAVNNTVAGTSGITVTQTATGNNLDIQTTAGANKWVGHIYNAGGPRPTPFTTGNYAGYYTIGTTNFNEIFGANNACIPVFSNGTQRATMYAEGFAVRYRMTYSNTAGCYLVKVTGDDGVRLSIDGGSTYVFNSWDEQGATTYDYILVNLSATTNFVLDYYENGGENRVSFDIIPFNPALNTITAPTTLNFCNGGDPAVIGGSMQYTSANENAANPYIKFQWQESINGVNFADIPGATSRTFDPPVIGATTTQMIYRYQRIAKSNVAGTGTACDFNPSNIVTITNNPPSLGGAASPNQAICTGAQPTNITLTGNVGAVTKWQKTTDATFATGIIDIAETTTTLSGSTIGNLTATTYFRAVIQNGNCTVANSSIVTITVNPLTVAGTITSSANSLCTVSKATLTLSGNTGSVLRWESSTDNFVSVITAITNSTTTLQTNNLTTTTYYRAVVQSGSCSTVYSNILSVNTGSPIATAATLPLCNGFTANWTKVPGATKYLLDVSTNGFSTFVLNGIDVEDNASYAVTGLLPNTAYTYRISPVYACGVYAIPSNSISITTASLAPVAAIAGGSATVCVNSLTPAFTDSTPSGVWSIIPGTGTASITTGGVVTGLTAGTVTVDYTVTNGGCSNKASISLTVNPTPTAPTASATKQPTCTSPTGTITISSPAEGTGFTYSINGTNYYPTAVFNTVPPSSIPYSVTVKNASGCTSSVTTVTVNNNFGKVWNGSTDNDWNEAANWTPAGVPKNTDCVIIPTVVLPTTIKQPKITTTADAYSLTVGSGVLLTVDPKAILTVVSNITVDTNGKLIFEDSSSLLQKTDNAVNTGNITYKRITPNIRRYDFTCWSSPIQSTPRFTLHDVSPLTLADKYFSYDTSKGWIISYNGVLPMEKGIGYIVRGPQYYDIVTPASFEASFIGTPNNGPIEITAEANKFILAGNPYPSAVNAKDFISDNEARGVEVGTLYFWTHNSPPANTIPGDRKYYYNTADYALFNSTGGTASESGANKKKPSGFIAAGASFFIKPNGTKVLFTNSMRVGDENDQFYKNTKKNKEDKNRLWLNFANTEGAFKQALVGYLDGATNEIDYNYDGPTNSGNAYVDFYSINEKSKLAIQGRALPFNDSDLVPLGYVSKIVGDFTISIDEADGFFDTQAVYLEDKKTGKITDLRAGNYTFATEKGTFDDRFVLRYTNKTLGTGDFENTENGLLVAVKDKTVKIISAKESIKEVTIFDINGKLLYDKKKIGATELQVSNLQAANQVLLVKVILENDFSTTRKIIFQ